MTLSTEELISTAELDLVRAVLQSHDQLFRASDVSPDYMLNSIARPIWRVIVANPETPPTASWLSQELQTFDEGRRALKEIAGSDPPVEALRSYLWSEAATAIGEVETHAQQVREHQKKELIEQAWRGRNPFLNADDQAAQLIRSLQKLIGDGGGAFAGRDHLANASDLALKEYFWLVDNPGKLLGWRMGDLEYDQLMGASDGVKGERLNVTMALTSHGKSVWLLKHALGYAQTMSDEFERYPKVLYVSVEMSARQISKRLIAQLSMVNMNQKSENPRAPELITAAQKQIKQLEAEERLMISERSNVDEIIRHATSLRLQDKLDILVIDYIGGLSGGSGGDRASSYMVTGGIAEALRGACHNLDLPIITAHQLNRAAYSSGKPSLENTADSSKVGHVAHTIQMFWRPSLTHPKISGPAAGIWHDVVIVTCEKNRSGPKSDLYYDINPTYSVMRPVPQQKLRILKGPDEQARLYSHKEP